MALSDEVLKEVGRVTTNFASLDFYIGIIIIELMKVHIDVGLMVTSEQSFRQKLKLLSSLVKHWNKLPAVPPHIKPTSLDALILKCENLEMRRNLVTHSLWSMDRKAEAAPKLFRIKTTAKQKKGLHHGFEEFSITDLTSLANEIRDTASSAMRQMFPPPANI
ncbi:MAG: hypothetical protein HY552_03890 [Elusimicrobia bacterium]|nr:hypothetical protein [Elusimicrobiota bacterium]